MKGCVFLMKKWIEDHKKAIIIWIVIIAILLAGPVIIYTGKSIFKWAWNNYQWSVGYNKPVPTPTPVPVPVPEPTIAPDPTPVPEPSESPSPTQPPKKKTVPKKEPVIAFSDKKIEQVHATSDGKSGHRQYRERTKDGRPDGVQFDGVFVRLKDCKTCYPPTKTKTTESKPDQKSTSTPKPPVISYKEGFEKPHTSGKGHREYSDKYVDGVFEKRVLLGTYLKNKDCALCFPHPKDIDPAPNYKPTPTPTPPPATTPSTIMDDGKMWKVDVSGNMVWVGPSDGKADIHQLGEWLIYIRNSHSATFTTTVPGKILITVGHIVGNGINQSFTTGSNEVQLSAGTYTVEYSIGSSGGFRWTPQQGYGWRK